MGRLMDWLKWKMGIGWGKPHSVALIDPVTGNEQEVQFAIAWDPSLMTSDQYAELVEIIGDLVRANGGAGIRRIAEYDAMVMPQPPTET